MAERMQTVLSRRSSEQRLITIIATRFERVKGEGDLDKFREIDSSRCLEAAEASDEPAWNRPVIEDIEMSEIYITRAEDVIFEANIYLEPNPVPPSPAALPAGATSSVMN